MRILSGVLLAGAVCLSVLTGCGGSGDEGAKDEAGGLDPKLKAFVGDWKNEESGAELTITKTGAASLTGWEDEDELDGTLAADNVDGVSSFDAKGDGKDGTPFHFLVEFRNDDTDRVYVDDTNESDVPPLALMKQD